MRPNQLSAHDIENARVALVLVVASALIFKHILLRAVLAILAVAAVVGTFVLFQGIHL